MKKVILIEDRPNRQINFTKKLNKDLNKISILENVCGFEKFNTYKKILSSSNLSQLDDFQVIIVHRSALSANERLRLVDFAKKNSKTLVLFSGGISSVTLQNIGNGILLTINSKDLYSNSFINYLENDDLNILLLAFGENWKINLEVSLLDKLIFYIIDYTPRPLSIILAELKVPEWIKENYFKNFDGIIQLNELQLLKEDIQNNLLKSI
ncbi:hypothetical protein [Bizionia paragorgiae]|uniref:Uncharacterized protein n=1 Tax=Bizionia paragorgiae TaxID=283786 RepID=A0A1H3X0Y1_BIZPA|nr:hypothetical protein [Bizionia paragorgiae]SDZ92890.1 hypothetical protein SAMN04487990_10493 [Bizionia paragorgiae]